MIVNLFSYSPGRFEVHVVNQCSSINSNTYYLKVREFE